MMLQIQKASKYLNHVFNVFVVISLQGIFLAIGKLSINTGIENEHCLVLVGYTLAFIGPEKLSVSRKSQNQVIYLYLPTLEFRIQE